MQTDRAAPVAHQPDHQRDDDEDGDDRDGDPDTLGHAVIVPGITAMTGEGGLSARKLRHIDACLTGPVDHGRLTTGLERFRALPYDALTQTSLSEVDLSTRFLDARLRAPIRSGR